jgi:mannose-6-phosphate isomerase-like protein (cupin superfamily)
LHALLVVAEARVVVREEHRPDQVAVAAHAGLAEDGFEVLLSGRIGAVLRDAEVVGEPGDLIHKPRGQWHTFWNAGDEPAAVLELISPGGLEERGLAVVAGPCAVTVARCGADGAWRYAIAIVAPGGA